MTDVQLPITAEALQLFLPHRPPMVWIDRVIAVHGQGATCEVILKADGPQCAAHGLRQSSVIEWIAQAVGFSQAAIFKQPVQRTYLAAANLQYSEQAVWDEFQSALKTTQRQNLNVTFQLIKTLGELSLITAQVLTQTGLVLATGTVKVWAQSA